MKPSLEQMQVSERRPIDQSKIAYQKPQPVGMVSDIFVGSALELDVDEREWVPQSPTVAFRPLVLNVTQGYYINILGPVRGCVVAPSSFRAGACLHVARKMALPRT